VLYDTIYCNEYSYLVLDTIFFARLKKNPSEVVIYLASRFEYPFTCIASVTFIFVAGFAWHAMKKNAAFSAQSSTLYERPKE
jgi:hypothetical protein